MKTIEVCHIEGSSSLLEELLIWTGASKNLLKKSLSKGQLSRTIRPRDILILPIDLLNHNKINPEYVGPRVEILFENDFVLALNKPTKIHMHPLHYDESDNLLSYLRENRPELLNVNKENYDRGMLFRLDYETSGVCFYAKTNDVYKKVREEFSEVVRNKEYYAIVCGKVEGEGELHDHLAPFGEKGQRQRVLFDQEANAHLFYRALTYNEKEDITLVRVRLITGLRHQIRVQLANFGHAILGDELYQGRKADRLYLHAYLYQISLGNLESQAIAPMDELFSHFFNFN